MEKYLGNKTALLPMIESFVKSRIPDASSLSDLFAGTTNVSRYFAGRGFEVTVGDLSRFSYVLAQAYVGQSEPPTFGGLGSIRTPSAGLDRLQVEFLRSVRKSGETYLPGLVPSQAWKELRPLAEVLAHLQEVGDRNEQPWIITQHFTQWGTEAHFHSARGSTGKRNYFSRRNALFLDGVLKMLRTWWFEGRVSISEIFLILTAVIEEVVITANVSGTFHDFNRDRLWPNALQQFFLRLPLISTNCRVAEITNDDAVIAAGYVRPHDVCYIDPPYNFRQYGAYYHFLNFIAAVPFIGDLNGYVAGFRQVRGQNSEDDPSSDFCSKGKFIHSLRSFIARVPAKHVVLSYYNGRNHWNHWSAVEQPTTEGLSRLTELFADRALFEDFEVVPALNVRRNYQSRVGESKGLINEYLFLGRRRASHEVAGQAAIPLPFNLRWGLDKVFAHSIPRTEETFKGGQMTGVA